MYSGPALRAAALLMVCVVAAIRGQAQFETRSSLSVGNYNPRSLVVGDFNRDGIPDLAVVSDVNRLSSGSLEIMLGNGDGTFRRVGNYAVGLQPYYAATSDFRGNGILDLVVGDSLSDFVYVMEGNGDGTFQSPESYPTTGQAYWLGVGDFIGHGKIDILVLEIFGCSCVEVLPGNGDGTFGEPITTQMPYGMSGYALATGDFNLDGKLDVAVAGEGYPNYEAAILLGNGDGTFDADGEYLVSATPQSIATGYFTSSKGKIDLAVANFLGSSVSVLLGDGDGTFQQSVFYDTNFPTWVIARDLDGDGKVDLAAANADFSPGVSVLKGNGDGTFQRAVFYPAGQEPNYLAAADFNGDGRPDLAVVDSDGLSVITLLNTGVVSFSPTTPLNFEKQAVGTVSAAQTVTITNTGTSELKIQSVKASAEFAVKSTCGSRVAAGEQCTISATFSPTRKGAVQGTITIIDNASSKPQVIELLGTGA